MPPTIELPAKGAKAAKPDIEIEAAPEKITVTTPEQSEKLRGILGELVEPRPERKPKKEPEAAPADKPPGDKPADKPKPEETMQEKMARVRAAKKEKPEPVAAPSAAEIATAVAREVVTAIKKDDPKPEPKPGEAATVEYPWLTDKQRKKLPVLERMEKGLGKRFAESHKALAEYQAKWEAEHEGQPYDPAAEEHNEFYAKHDVDYDPDEYAETAADIRAEAIRKEQTDREQAATEQHQFAERARGHEATAAKEANRIGNAVAKDIGDGYEKIFDANGVLDQAACKELDENDPVITPIIFNGVTQAQLLAAETTRMFNGTGTGPDGKITKLDMGKLSPMQRDIIDFAVKRESELLSLPASDQRDERGRMFTTSQRFYAMPDAERAKFWTFSAKEINELRGAEIARVTKEQVKTAESKLEKSAARRKFVRQPEGDEIPPKPAQNGHVPKAPVDDEDPNDKPDPVTTNIGARASSPQGGGGDETQKGVRSLLGDFLDPRSK